MARSQRPRKSYRPRRIDADPVDLAISRAALLTDAQRAALTTPTTTALQRLRTGGFTPADWKDLADAMNVAEALAELRIVSDHGDSFAAAQAALANLITTHRTRGRWVARGAELTAIDTAAWLHRIQLAHCTQGELDSAIRRVQRRVRGALAGNVGPGVQVLGFLGAA